MILFISFLFVLFIAGGLLGYFRIVQVAHLNKSRVLAAFLTALTVLTLMSAASWLGIFTESIAIKITMSLYSLAAGFFIGYGIKLISLRSQAGKLEYMYRSFWIDVAPNLVAAGLFVFGVYRTGILFWDIFTGIGVTSGISLIAFAFLGWTIHIVPEFRFKGILLLDQYIHYEKLVTFEWIAENTLRVEYFIRGKQISEFKTYIPAEDQSVVERILREKMEDYKEERKKQLL